MLAHNNFFSQSFTIFPDERQIFSKLLDKILSRYGYAGAVSVAERTFFQNNWFLRCSRNVLGGMHKSCIIRPQCKVHCLHKLQTLTFQIILCRFIIEKRTKIKKSKFVWILLQKFFHYKNIQFSLQ